MKPIRLCLKGFSGILAGLGRNEFSIDLEQAAAGAELVAIAGPNGTGKTTILDNLHPYRVMPSRAGADSLGAFSFYEHLSLPEAEKALIWEHAGVRYRSQLLFRMNGRKKTDAYLHVWREGVWHPAVVSDGTLSDGKTDTYDRCIESILGSAETFFTSQFAAQGQRPLSAYRNGEIKNLLADLLGLESIQETGRQATEVAKLLRAGLVTARSELAGLEVELRALEEGQFRCDTLELAMQEGRNRKMQAGRALDEAQQTLANLNASAAVAAQHDALRARLQASTSRPKRISARR